jgi:methyl-accepting chemotaxis protein
MFRKMSLRSKMMTGFAIVIVLMTMAAFIGRTQSSRAFDEARSLYTVNVQATVDLAEAETAVWRLRYGFPQYLVLKEEERAKIVAEEPDLYAKVEAAMADYAARKTTMSAEERTAHENFKAMFKKYSSARPHWFELVNQGRMEEAASYRAQTTTPFGADVVKILSELIRIQRAANDESLTATGAIEQRASTLTLIVVGVAVVFSLLGTVILTRVVVGPISQMIRAMEQSSERLVKASSEIYSVSISQETSAQQQAAAVEEVARTLQQLSEAAVNIADAASGVANNAAGTKDTANLTAQKIAELSRQTARMTDILDAIREIADRSDLLALNASLEGTRAGESGKGFSLVADEMRRLAERVAQSVKDVKDVVNEVRESGASTVFVTEEARKLAESTAEAAKQITLVTRQQRLATEEVSRNIKEVYDTIRHAVDATKHSKGIAEELKSQAETLSTSVQTFRSADARPTA